MAEKPRTGLLALPWPPAEPERFALDSRAGLAFEPTLRRQQDYDSQEGKLCDFDA